MRTLAFDTECALLAPGRVAPPMACLTWADDSGAGIDNPDIGLRRIRDALRGSDAAREILGEPFVDHYVRTRDWEAREYRKAVSDWELRRYFEAVRCSYSYSRSSSRDFTRRRSTALNRSTNSVPSMWSISC